ncbi:DUF6174 domain-containing protein [Thalassotalea litorea]|uniref:DUF6174 domain-containing protein n=1 Tax=Thalassotalea litorea TaxID=2020715 RepID=UPI003735E62E
MKRLILLSAVLLLTACGSDEENNEIDLTSLITENQRLWNSQGIIDYQFTVQVSLPDCDVADEIPALDIQVEDNQVAGVYVSGTSIAVDTEEALTVDNMFVLMLGVVYDKPDHISDAYMSSNLPQFDPNLGYPTSFFFDYTSSSCDAYQYIITDFI